MKSLTSVFLIVLFRIKIVASGGNALLKVKSSEGDDSFCISYNSQYQRLPSTLEEASYHVLNDFSQIEGCTLTEFPPTPKLDNSTVALMRGNCTFIQKAAIAESLHAHNVLIVDNKNSTKTPVPGGNSTDYKFINITLAIISWNDYSRMLQLHKQPISAKLYSPVQALWDHNMIIIVVLSTLFVMLGAGWAALKESRMGNRLRKRGLNSNSSNPDSPTQASSPEQQFTVWMVVIWFVLICAVIVLLYFFYDMMVYFFIAMFCLAGSYSLYQCLLPVWSQIVPLSYDIPLHRFPCIKTKVKLRSFLLYMPCLTLAIFWAIERHARYAWDGDSIMESVATGGSGHSKESLPMVFLFPLLGNNPLSICRERSYSLLGFGDIIIPGLLVSYNAVFDIRSNTKMVYYLSSSLGYLLGMVICMISLVFMNSGQPALLYLVPCTLITTVVIALFRRELRKLMFGSKTQSDTQSFEEPKIIKDAEEPDTNNDSVDEEQRTLIN
ncbi:Signal peptide peptidase-like 2B [Bulinus truncatus]|nr:Signal peptide peptidase-like 2B [Bulinus truncatus]